jgi:hypothetical protein
VLGTDVVVKKVVVKAAENFTFSLDLFKGLAVMSREPGGPGVLSQFATAMDRPVGEEILSSCKRLQCLCPNLGLRKEASRKLYSQKGFSNA